MIAVAGKILEIIGQDMVRMHVKVHKRRFTHSSQTANVPAHHRPATAAMTDGENALLHEGQVEGHLHAQSETETTTAAAIGNHQALHLHRANQATELHLDNLWTAAPTTPLLRAEGRQMARRHAM